MHRLFLNRYYVLSMLTAMSILTGVERSGLGLMMQDIKTEFALTDTQLGLLGGIAFALFYSVMGIPIARWADRGNRVSVLSLAMLLLSIGTAICSSVGSFIQLLLARVGVAVGEAGCLPPSLSLIADYFSRSERPRAVAAYTGAGGAATAVVGAFGMGWLIELYGWRQAFLLLSVPGLVLATLARFTIREPRVVPSIRAVLATDATGTSSSVHPSLREVSITVLSCRSFRHLVMCLAVLTFFNVGTWQWMPTYFIRSFGLTTGEIGTGLAIVFGVTGVLGAYLGGELASHYAAQNERLQLCGVAATIVLSGIFAAFIYLAPGPYWAFGFNGLMMLALVAISGPLLATMQTLVPDDMRAVAFALAYLVANLIGLGLGPLAAGALSDALRPWVGEDSVRYALLMLAPGYGWAAWHAWRASRTVWHDLEAAPTSRNVSSKGLATPPLCDKSAVSSTVTHGRG